MACPRAVTDNIHSLRLSLTTFATISDQTRPPGFLSAIQVRLSPPYRTTITSAPTCSTIKLPISYLLYCQIHGASLSPVVRLAFLRFDHYVVVFLRGILGNRIIRVWDLGSVMRATLIDSLPCESTAGQYTQDRPSTFYIMSWGDPRKRASYADIAHNQYESFKWCICSSGAQTTERRNGSLAKYMLHEFRRSSHTAIPLRRRRPKYLVCCS